MRRVLINEQVTLDGVMQGPGAPDEDRSGGFEHGGWAMPYFDEVMGEAAGDGMGSAGGLLLGRMTYEIFAAYWPKQGDDVPFASFLNSVPKVRRLENLAGAARVEQLAAVDGRSRRSGP